jgi:hypothetical protein
MAAASQTPTLSGVERLGPAERIIQTCIAFGDHVYHGRPGIVRPMPVAPIGVAWTPVTHAVEEIDGEKVKVVYALPEQSTTPAAKGTKRKGKQPKAKTVNAPERRLGLLLSENRVVEGLRVVGRYQEPGLCPEACVWLYRQVAEIWKLDNEFAGRWASYAYAQEHEDLKVVLCAFLLCQSRVGHPVMEEGKRLFDDMNLRSVGRAMMLLAPKPLGMGTDGQPKATKPLNAKLVLRVRKLLTLPGIVQINRELGFAHGPRSLALNGWERTARDWLRQRERNPKMLDGLLRTGFGDTVRFIAASAHYKPDSPTFFKKLRWFQTPGAGGHRGIAIGDAVDTVESWEGLDEVGVCERITKERPDWKKIVGSLPASVGVTRAVMTAAIEAGSLSDKDLIIATPTLEELGLLEVQEVRARWDKACAKATDMRAAHIARNVTTKDVADKLQEAADTALKTQVEAVTREIDVYFMVDVSSSMQGAIESGKGYLAKLLQGFPPERVHIAIFTTQGREIALPHPSAAGVAAAFQGVRAEGGTDYGAPLVRSCLGKYANAERDALLFYVGDEGHNGLSGMHGGRGVNFADAVRASGINPVAIALVPVISPDPRFGRADCVRTTATELGIPYFEVDTRIFDDAYAIPRTIRNLIASTPVRAVPRTSVVAPRKTLVEIILETPLLAPPLGL